MPLTDEHLRQLAREHGTPLYIYDNTSLQERAESLLKLELPFGLTVRYAVKANPHPSIIELFNKAGLHFDASSSYEADALLRMGVAGEKISLSSQQPVRAHHLPELLEAGVQYVATSLRQLDQFAQATPFGTHVALRVNTGLGSGHNNRTTTAGVTSSFGLWHEYLDQALEIASDHGLIISRLHTHIGSGADPDVWREAIDSALEIAERLPHVTTLDMGGGYKVHRYGEEQETDMAAIAKVFGERLQAFAQKTGRKLKLEIEPGTWLVAHAGYLLTEIVDIVDTGERGFTFLRTNTGMNDFLRPTMYGAQHTLRVLNNSEEQTEYVVVGHNCESGDIITTAPGNPEVILPRHLKKAAIGDVLCIMDAGAYCASMRARGYNSFPEAKELFV